MEQLRVANLAPQYHVNLTKVYDARILAMEEHLMRMLAAVDGNHDPSVTSQGGIVRFLENQRVATNLGHAQHSAFKLEANIHIRRVPRFVVNQHADTYDDRYYDVKPKNVLPDNWNPTV